MKDWDLRGGSDSYFWFGMSSEYYSLCESLDINKIKRDSSSENMYSLPSNMEINFSIDFAIQYMNFELSYEQTFEKLAKFYKSNSLLMDKGFVPTYDGLGLPFRLDLCKLGEEHPHYTSSLIPLNNTLNTILEVMDEFNKFYKMLI